jgi:hypothetical protein
MAGNPNLFPPPTTATLPLSLSADVQVTFRNTVPGSDPPEYVDYPPGVTISLIVGRQGETVAEAVAVITGSDAICEIPAAVADTLKPGLPWRCVVSAPDGAGGYGTLVAINGPIGRFDGI